MSSTGTRIRRIPTAGLTLAALVTWGLVVGGGTAAAATDTTPPSVPQNLRADGAFRGQPVLRWDASTDDVLFYHYWVLVDGQQRARPAATTYNIDTLVQLCRITPGPHTITVQAVDRALNRSAPSNPVHIVVT